MANEEMLDQEIEHASDDEEKIESDVGPYQDASITSRTRGQKRRTIDEDYEEKMEVEGVEEEDSDELAPMDDLEPEHISDEEEEARKKKSGKESTKGWTRRHRTDIEDAQLEGDEQEETVFIDNLPNDEIAIKAMLVQVAKHIAQLEKRFFEEENSDVEEEDKNDDPSQSPEA